MPVNYIEIAHAEEASASSSVRDPAVGGGEASSWGAGLQMTSEPSFEEPSSANSGCRERGGRENGDGVDSGSADTRKEENGARLGRGEEERLDRSSAEGEEATRGDRGAGGGASRRAGAEREQKGDADGVGAVGGTDASAGMDAWRRFDGDASDQVTSGRCAHGGGSEGARERGKEGGSEGEPEMGRESGS